MRGCKRGGRGCDHREQGENENEERRGEKRVAEQSGESRKRQSVWPAYQCEHQWGERVESHVLAKEFAM